MPFALTLVAILAIAGPDAEASATGGVPANDEQESTSLVLISPRDATSSAELRARVRRVQAELDVAGFDVIPIAAAMPDVLAAGDDASSRVVVVLDPSRMRAVLWLRDDDGFQEVATVVGQRDEPDADAVFALRLTEIARALLIEVAPPPTPAPDPVATPPVDAPPPPRPGPTPPMRWSARVGAHAVASSGRLGAMVGPTLGGTIVLGPQRRAGIDVELLATALQGRTAGDAGTAKVGFATARVHAGFWPVPHARISPGFGLGLGVLTAWTRGSGRGAWVGRTDVTAVALPSAATDLAIRLVPRLRLRFGARLGVALPGVNLLAPERTVRAAQPLFDGGIALEVTG
jgi:hypothetical protein